jgi:hypothetical protein
MLERMLLAGIMTFCIYLFLNFGSKPANAPSLDAKSQGIPGFINRIALLDL